MSSLVSSISMPMNCQYFHLCLNNNSIFLTESLNDLFRDDSLTDCVLTAQGQEIRAHRLVLSAYSPYFKHAFTSYHNLNQMPIIFLKDMTFCDLKNIINFIYRGEVTIPSNQLDSLIQSGASLQIKGLIDANMSRNKSCGGNNLVNANSNSETSSDDCVIKNARCENEGSNGDHNASDKQKKPKKRRVKKKVANNVANIGKDNEEMAETDKRGHNGMTSASDGVSFGDNCASEEKRMRKDSEEENDDELNDEVRDEETSLISPCSVLEQSMVEMEKNDGEAVEDANDLCLHGYSVDEERENNSNDETDMDNEVEDDESVTCDEHYVDEGYDHANSSQVSPKSVSFSVSAFQGISGQSHLKSVPDSDDMHLIQPAKLKISRAGIPRKGFSIRNTKKHKCPECHKVYVSSQNMKEHLRNVHTHPNDKYVCPIESCGLEYSWKHALDRHIKSKHKPSD